MQEAQASHNNFKIVSTDIAPVEQMEASKSKAKQPNSTESENVETKSAKTVENARSPVISIDQLRIKKEENIILVLGSEGEGVSKSINQLADYRVMIPPQLRIDQIGKYPFNMVDSLNVGVSAGLLIYHIRHLMNVL